MEYIETFPYVVKYKTGMDNVVADALSRRFVLLTSLDTSVLGFSLLKDLYCDDVDFKDIFNECMKHDGATGARTYYVHEGFLFKGC